MTVISEIAAEVKRHGADGNDADRTWSEWVAIATGYVGRAAPAMYRNKELNPREMMIKAAAVIVSAIEAMDDK